MIPQNAHFKIWHNESDPFSDVISTGMNFERNMLYSIMKWICYYQICNRDLFVYLQDMIISLIMHLFTYICKCNKLFFKGEGCWDQYLNINDWLIYVYNLNLNLIKH